MHAAPHLENTYNQEKLLNTAIDKAAANGIPSIIVFSGSLSAGLSAEQGADNCVAILNRIKAHAEDEGVNLSSVASPGLSIKCNATAWALLTSYIGVKGIGYVAKFSVFLNWVRLLMILIVTRSTGRVIHQCGSRPDEARRAGNK